MERSEIIINIKNKIIAELVNDEEIIQALGLNDDESPDDLVWVRFFLHDYVPATQDSVKSYINVEIDMPERRVRYGETPSDIWIHSYIMFRVLVHQEDMRLNLPGESATRMDYLAMLIEKKFRNRQDFGIGKIRAISNTAGSVNNTYRWRLLLFEVVDATDVCG